MALLERASGAGQGQLPLVLGVEPLGRSYKVICSWLLLVLGLEVLRRSCAAKQGQLPFVPA